MQGGMSEWCGGEATAEPATGLQRPQSPCRRPLRGAAILAVLCFLCGKSCLFMTNMKKRGDFAGHLMVRGSKTGQNGGGVGKGGGHEKFLKP